MQKIILLISGIGLTFTMIPTAYAQQVEERYRLERTENGYVRMDNNTGEMSLCQETGGELVCKPARDDTPPLVPIGEIEKLQAKIDTLEQRITALEAGSSNNLPSENEFEQSLNMMERFFRRFVDVVRSLGLDNNNDGNRL